ncbi:MAG: amino acid ABC transporter permease [Dethiobacteria bacterium]|jgi:His/Glu/Gln/Arg/opine family amino acid ABC transporter permease subunit
MKFLDYTVVINNWPFLMLGLRETLRISSLAVTLGFCIGSFVALARLSRSRFLKLASGAYIEFIRGTPLLVQLFILYYGLPQLGIDLDRRAAAAIGLSINSGAYVAEIVRAGIQSIDKGQMEAARSLGMSGTAAMIHVILPQAFRRVIPPLVNELIMLIKDSSLLSVIALTELMRAGEHIRTRTYKDFEIFTAIALIYFVITYTLSKILGYLERRLQTSD